MTRVELVTELEAIQARLKTLEAEARSYRREEKGDDVDTYIWSAASRLRVASRALAAPSPSSPRSPDAPTPSGGSNQEG